MPMRRYAPPLETLVVCVLGFLVLHPARQIAAQEPIDASGTLRVFLDCQTFRCDFDHFRREIPFVDWMRDRADAEVHVLGTSERTGGGGERFTFAFLGQGRFAGRADTLAYVSANTDTDPEVRDGLVRTVKLGLVPFLAATPDAERLRVTWEGPDRALLAGASTDPWDLWVFTLGLDGDFDGESEERSLAMEGEIEAERTSENVKLRFQLSGRYGRDEFDIPELDSTIVSVRKRSGASARSVWSLDEHWSAGAAATVFRDTYYNLDLSVTAGPAIEYDIFPYSESTRRQITFQYQIGVGAYDFTEITVFGETSEVRPLHRADVGVEFRQPWGTVGASLAASQYLHDLEKHSVGLWANLEIRLFRGLGLEVYTRAERVKDQLYLSGVGLTPEERLLRVRALETDFRYRLGIGLQYRFGSKVANVVNPRLGGLGW